MRISRILLLAIASFAITLAACESGDQAKVSEGDLKAVQTAAADVSPGMSKDQVMTTFEKGQKTKLTEASISGATVEEWRIMAYHDDDWNKSRQSYSRFFYFVNDKLVDISDTRIKFRENPQIVTEWMGGK